MIKDIQAEIDILKKQLPKIVRKPKKLPVALSEDEFILLIKKSNMKHHKLAYLLGFGSGLRISEILNLQPSDCNFTNRSILVREGKGSKDRTVPMPKGFKEENLKLLPFKSGARALQKAFKRSCQKAGLLKDKPSLHFHSLRHGFATQCVKQNIPIHHIRTLMGHSNISTTNIYLEANPKEALKSYEELF